MHARTAVREHRQGEDVGRCAVACLFQQRIGCGDVTDASRRDGERCGHLYPVPPLLETLAELHRTLTELTRLGVAAFLERHQLRGAAVIRHREERVLLDPCDLGEFGVAP